MDDSRLLFVILILEVNFVIDQVCELLLNLLVFDKLEFLISLIDSDTLQGVVVTTGSFSLVLESLLSMLLKVLFVLDNCSFDHLLIGWCSVYQWELKRAKAIVADHSSLSLKNLNLRGVHLV